MKHTKENFNSMKDLLNEIWNDGKLEINDETISFRLSNEIWQKLEDFLNTVK